MKNGAKSDYDGMGSSRDFSRRRVVRFRRASLICALGCVKSEQLLDSALLWALKADEASILVVRRLSKPRSHEKKCRTCRWVRYERSFDRVIMAASLSLRLCAVTD